MQKKAYLSIISAAALWGCIGVFLRLLTAAGLDSMESVAVRSTVAAILYFFWLLFTDRAAVRVRLQDLWYFVGTGIFSVLFFNWCYFKNGGGSTPPAATVYRTLEGNEGWKCTICGYVAEKETLPEGYQCPICRANRDKFVKL